MECNHPPLPELPRTDQPDTQVTVRCARCGHRRGTRASPPRQTRELPVILWPFEIVSRIEARIRGWLARKGRLPL